MTRAELQQRIAVLEARLRDLDAERAFVTDDLVLCRNHLARLHFEQERTKDRSNMELDMTGLPLRARMGARRAKRTHAALECFYRAGVNVTGVAKEIGETRSRVDSWMRTKDTRPIPIKHRDYLRRKYGVPNDAWLRVEE